MILATKWDRKLDVSELRFFDSHNVYSRRKKTTCFSNFRMASKSETWLIFLKLIFAIIFPRQELNILLEINFFSVWREWMSMRLKGGMSLRNGMCYRLRNDIILRTEFMQDESKLKSVRISLPPFFGANLKEQPLCHAVCCTLEWHEDYEGNLFF